MLYSSDSLVGQLTNEYPMGMITTPGCEKYVFSVLTPFHLTTCRSCSKAPFFPIKVRVSCAQYEQHKIDDMPKKNILFPSDHLKTTLIQHLVIPAFIPILLIFTVFNKMLKIKISTDEKGEQE